MTPDLARIFPASLSFSSASASRSRSTVTKESPAFSATFCAWSNTRASRGRQIKLARAAAGDFRHFRERGLGRRQRVARAAAGTVDQAAGQSFRIVQQDLQQMFGRELLVPLAQGERLRGLHKAARTFGKFLKIHKRCPL